jgi:hypothetical protein
MPSKTARNARNCELERTRNPESTIIRKEPQVAVTEDVPTNEYTNAVGTASNDTLSYQETRLK